MFKLNFFILFALGFIILFSCKNSGNKSTKIDTKFLDSIDKITFLPDKVRLLDSFAKQNPENADLHFRLSKAYDQNHQLEKALEQATLALKNDTAKEAYYLYMADLFMEKPSVKNAINAYESLLARKPNSTAALLKLGIIYTHLKEYDKSFDYLGKALKVDPNLEDAYFYAGFNYKEQGNTDIAIKNFQKVIELDPNKTDAYVLLGILYQDRNPSLAEGYFNTAIRLSPTDTSAIYSRGKFFQDQKDYKKAITDYRKVMNMNINHRGANYGTGFCFYSLKKFDSSLTYFNKVIFNNPLDGNARYGRAEDYKALGMKLQAQKEMKIVDSLDNLRKTRK